MLRRPYSMIVALLLAGVSLTFAQETPSSESPVPESGEKIDVDAELAAAAAPIPNTPFKKLWTSEQRFRLLSGLTISRNGKRVSALASNGDALTFNADTGELISKTPITKPDFVVCTALSGDGAYAALGFSKGPVRIVDTSSGKIVFQHSLPKEDARALKIHFDEEGKHVSIVDSSGKFGRYPIQAVDGERMTLFDLEAPKKALSREEAFNQLTVMSLEEADFSPDGRQLTLRPFNLSRKLAHAFLSPEVKERELINSDMEGMARGVCRGRSLFAVFTGVGNITITRQPAPRTFAPNPQTVECRLTADTSERRFMAVSSDDARLMVVGRGQAELRALDSAFGSTVHDADFRFAAQAALAPDALRFAVIDEQGKLSVHELGEMPYSPSRRFIPLLLKLMKEKRYDELETIGDRIQDDPVPYAWNYYLSNYLLFTSVLQSRKIWDDDRQFELGVREWLKAKPESKVARTLSAEILLNQAWEVRGSNFAFTVSPEAWDKYHARLLDVKNTLQPLLDGPRPPPDAITHMIDVAKGEGWERDEYQPYVDKLMTVSPRFLRPHLAMSEKLLMRWGGRRLDDVQYASNVADKIGGGAGDAVYAHIAIRLAMYLPPREILDEAGFEYERIQNGFRFEQESVPGQRDAGVAGELLFAMFQNDLPRLKDVATRIEREKIPLAPGIFPWRIHYEEAYRRGLGE